MYKTIKTNIVDNNLKLSKQEQEHSNLIQIMYGEFVAFRNHLKAINYDLEKDELSVGELAKTICVEQSHDLIQIMYEEFVAFRNHLKAINYDLEKDELSVGELVKAVYRVEQSHKRLAAMSAFGQLSISGQSSSH